MALGLARSMPSMTTKIAIGQRQGLAPPPSPGSRLVTLMKVPPASDRASASREKCTDAE